MIIIKGKISEDVLKELESKGLEVIQSDEDFLREWGSIEHKKIDLDDKINEEMLKLNMEITGAVLLDNGFEGKEFKIEIQSAKGYDLDSDREIRIHLEEGAYGVLGEEVDPYEYEDFRKDGVKRLLEVGVLQKLNMDAHPLSYTKEYTIPTPVKKKDYFF